MSADRITYRQDGNAQSFEGRGAVDAFAMFTIASALDLYAKTGMQANRAYTPRAMMAAATHHTGKKFKARDYAGAAAALREKATAEKQRIDLEGIAQQINPAGQE